MKKIRAGLPSREIGERPCISERMFDTVSARVRGAALSFELFVPGWSEPS